MLRPCRALIDPLSEQLDLLRLQRLVELRRRHDRFGIVRRDAGEQFALRGFAGNEGKTAAAESSKRAVLGVKPELGLALLVVGSVAGETMFRQDGPNLPVEIN